MKKAKKAKREGPLPNRTVDGELACALHEKWLGPHPLCAAETARVCGIPVEDVPVPDLSRFAANAATREDGLVVQLDLLP